MNRRETLKTLAGLVGLSGTIKAAEAEVIDTERMPKLFVIRVQGCVSEETGRRLKAMFEAAMKDYPPVPVIIMPDTMEILYLPDGSEADK